MVTSHGFRCVECADEVRWKRGCGKGYRQALGHEYRPIQPSTCPVVTSEPHGFWAANELAHAINQGAPVITLDDVTHAELTCARLVRYELGVGEELYRKRGEGAAQRASSLFPKGAT